MVDEHHWDGLPDGRARATTVDPPPDPFGYPAAGQPQPPASALAALLTLNPGATATVAQRSLRDYERVAGADINRAEVGW